MEIFPLEIACLIAYSPMARIVSLNYVSIILSELPQRYTFRRGHCGLLSKVLLHLELTLSRHKDSRVAKGLSEIIGHYYE